MRRFLFLFFMAAILINGVAPCVRAQSSSAMPVDTGTVIGSQQHPAEELAPSVLDAPYPGVPEPGVPGTRIESEDREPNESTAPAPTNPKEQQSGLGSRQEERRKFPWWLLLIGAIAVAAAAA